MPDGFAIRLFLLSGLHFWGAHAPSRAGEGAPAFADLESAAYSTVDAGPVRLFVRFAATAFQC